MRPKREPEQPQRELLEIDLEQLIDMSHPLVRLGVSIDWQSFEQTLGGTYHPSQGAPGISTRLMVALHYLKYQQDLSDEDVVAMWVENPYWQHFSGMRYFQHRMPIDPSSMTRWRKRLGDAGAERTQIFIANYSQKESDRLGLGLRFIAIAPRIVPDTDLGKHAITGYSRYLGISAEDFARGMAAPPTACIVATAVIELVLNPDRSLGDVFIVSGKGLEALAA